MTSLLSKNPLVKMIVDGKPDSDMYDMLLNKQLPFTELEYLETLVFVIKKDEYKKQAVEKIKLIADEIKKSYVEKNLANLNVAYFILIEALSLIKNEILTKIIHNNYLPDIFLVKIAEKGNAEILETLVENQIRLIAHSKIIKEMEKNPNINSFTKGKINEIKQFYLTNEKAEEIKIDNPNDEIFTSIKETEEKPQKEFDNDNDKSENIEDVQETVLSRLQEINNMTVADRVKTALLGTKADRSILIRDSNKLVSQAVINSPKMSIDEISAILKNKSVAGDLVAKIAKRKEWTKSYQIIFELVMNPKTPVSDALGFLKKLHSNDIKMIKRDKNVSPVIRKFALQLQIQKEG
jgi:hypothetical protein